VAARPVGRLLALIALTLVLVSLVPARPVAADEPIVGQYRAYWVDAFHDGFKTPAQVDRLLRHVRASNMNAVIVQVRRRGDAYFSRSVDPRTDDPAVPADFDPLEYLIEQAHAGPQPVEVHAWVAAFPVWRAAWALPAAPHHVINRHGPRTSGGENWLSWSATGVQHDGVNYAIDPGHPEAVNYSIEVFLDLVRNYNVDGLHLDYIRYGSADQGYNPVNVARFNWIHGRSGSPAANDPAWVKWRQDQVTNFVRKLYLQLYQVRPSVKLSAALIPWGNGPVRESDWPRSSPMIRAYQDWRTWLEEGIVDLGIPMVYFRDQRSPDYYWFDQWAEWSKNHQYRRQVILGPGIFLNTPGASLAQIWRALSPSSTGYQSAGVALYSYAEKANTGLTDQQFAQYLTGFGEYSPFRGPAAIPDMPWKSRPTEGHLFGHVVDAGGRALEGVAVTLNGPVIRRQLTDGTGFYGFVDLPPGYYAVQAAGPGGSSAVWVSAGTAPSVTLLAARD